MVVNIGPCQVLFNGSPLGKTRGGAYFSFKAEEVEWVNALGVLDRAEVFVGAEGTIKRFSMEEVVDVCLMGDWGELEFRNECESWRLVWPSARLYFPQAFRLGTFDQQTWDVRVVARRPLGGQLYRLEAI